MKGVLLCLPCFVAGLAVAALPKTTDHWRLDGMCSPQDMMPVLTSDQNPQRQIFWNERAIVGVPGAIGQCVWCLPGAAGRIASAMILPPKADFTFAFFAVFPDPVNGELSLFHNPKMSVGVSADGRFRVRLAGDEVVGGASVADRRWHLLAVTRRGTTLSLWQDGRPIAARENVRGTVYDDISTQWSVLDATNANRVCLDEIAIWNQALDEGAFSHIMAQIKDPRAMPTFSAEDERRAVAAQMAADPPFAEEGDYTALRIPPGSLRTFAEQHDVQAVAAPLFDPKGRDLICHGSIFGSKPLLYRFLRLENGVPVYAQGEPYAGPDVREAAMWRHGASDCRLCRFEANKLVEYRHEGTCAFSSKRQLRRTDGSEIVRHGNFAFTDVDGDGVEDLVEMTCRGNGNPCGGFPWPDGQAHPWQSVDSPYSGVGRGYDMFGNWMGTEVIAEVQWSKGVLGSDSSLRFDVSRPILVDMPDYPGIRRKLTWKLYMGIVGAATFSAGSGRYLALYGDMNRLVALPIRMENGDAFCGRPRPLLKDGYETPHCYWIHHLDMVDADGDGKREMLIDGNPGTIAVLKGTEPGTWTSARAYIEGGDICGETLSAAARIDWDGDGLQDLVLSDASGWLTFHRGTKDPLVYETARSFTVGGRPFCIKAGDSGSIQGKPEKIWGYVKVAAGVWGTEKALVTVDIKGDLLLHTRAGEDLLELRTRPFRRPNGVPLKVGWRSRPDFVTKGFAGAEYPSLLLQDLDNDLTVATPDAEGSVTLSTFRKLRYADGSVIRPSGLNGLSGRAHTTLVDWDGDGCMDIIFGNNASSQRFFDKSRRHLGSSLYILRNVGADAAPAFAGAVPMILRKNGKRLGFGWHNATPWATDLNGDGKPDLLVSAENGKVYAFLHDEIGLCGEVCVPVGLKVNGLLDPRHLDGTPSFSWRMESNRPGARQTAYRLTVEGAWDSGVVEGENSIGIVYSGKPLASAHRYKWKVSVRDETGAWSESASAGFSTGLLNDGDWGAAQWIAPDTPGPHGYKTALFRRELVAEKPVAEAWLTVAGAGVFVATVNGRPMTDDILLPGATHAQKVRQACTYEVTRLLNGRPGDTNVVEVTVSTGWSRDRIAARNAVGRKLDPARPGALKARLVLRFDDGSNTCLVTDGAWQAAEGGPLVAAGIYEGEEYDARGGEPPVWKPAVPNADFKGTVRNFRGPPVTLRRDLALSPRSAYLVKGADGSSPECFGTARVVRRFAQGEAMTVRPGEQLVVDFGQNASAVPEFVFEAARGTRVTVRHAEMLNEGNGLKSRGNDGPSGTPYLANLRSSFAGVRYTCRGNGAEGYRPNYTFFGYRYIGVTADAPLTVRRVRSLPVTSVQSGCDTGFLETDNPRVNRLLANCRWGMYSNYLSVPTDCPQRDERVGWTADTQVFAPAAAYLADVYPFLSKWMCDMRDSQRSDGCFAQIAPENAVRGAVTGWTDAGVIVPYILWRRYGDRAVIRENWTAMVRYLDYVARKGSQDPQPYGDWLSYEYGADMEWLKPVREQRQLPRKLVLNAAYRVMIGRMMSEMADALGDTAASAKYSAFAEREKDLFRKTCLKRDGTLLDECDGQCSGLFALYLKLLPSAAAEAATKRNLRENFRRNGDCLRTGFLGTAILLDAVTEGLGDTELAYTLLLQDRDPSWLHSVDQGATTIWERWNSYTKSRGFGPVAMNSFNHYAYGAVAGWMFSTMAGIRAEEPGFRKIRFAPKPDGRFGRVSAKFDSPYGRIESEWVRKNGGWQWSGVVPANTSAIFEFPDGSTRDLASGTHTLDLCMIPADGMSAGGT